MFKLVLEKAEEPEIKLPTSVDHGKSKRVPEKHLFLHYWLCQSLWLCESQWTVENSERGGGGTAPHKVRGVGESIKQTLLLGVDAREQGVSGGLIPPVRMLKPPSSWPLTWAEFFMLDPSSVDHNKLRKILKEMGIPDHLTCLLRNLYADQEATVRTGHGTRTGFK